MADTSPPSYSSILPDTSDSVSTYQINEIVNGRFATMQEAAAETYQATKQYIGEIQALAESFVVPGTDELSDIVDVEIPAIDYSGRPSLGGLTLPSNWPENKPVMGALDPLPDIIDYPFPVKSFPDMTWSLVERPVMDVYEAPSAPPSIGAIDDVGALETPVIPAIPVLADIVIPSAPEVLIPTLEAALVENYISIPSGFSWSSSQYNSEVWDNLLSNVLSNLKDSGTGLGADIEDDIWKEAQRRQELENERRYRDIESGFAARGWKLPTGALANAMLEVAADIGKNNTDLNAKIAISQAELAQKNLQFTIEQAVKVEEVLRGFFTASENRSLESAKSLASNAIEMTNALISKANVETERFGKKVLAYQARMEGATKQLEVYRLNLEAAKLQSDLRKDDIDLYEKRVMAVELVIRIHSLKIENAKLKKEVEQINLQNFEIATKIYLSKLESNKIKADLYGKDIEAEATKAQMYAEQNRAWVAEMDALKAKNDLQIKKLEAVATKNNQVLDQYKGELSGYSAEIDAASKIVDATVRGFEAETRGYEAETGALEAMYSTKVKEIDARISKARFQVDKAVAEINAAVGGYVAIKELQLKSIEGPMQVGAQLTASAWNAVNASASVTGSSSRSESLQHSKSASTSVGHHYEHPVKE